MLHGRDGSWLVQCFPIGVIDNLSTYSELAELLKLLADKTRLMILGMLNEKEMCVCDIVEVLDMTQPNVSQHLRKLKAGGLVKEDLRSQWVYYSLNIDDKPYLLDLFDQLPSMKDQFATLQSDSCS